MSLEVESVTRRHQPNPSATTVLATLNAHPSVSTFGRSSYEQAAFNFPCSSNVTSIMSLSRSKFAWRTCQRLSRRTFASSTRALADHVRIVEVGPRDGLQNEKSSISAETKIELVRRLAGTGLQTIEAGSFVHPKWVPQVDLPRLSEQHQTAEM